MCLFVDLCIKGIFFDMLRWVLRKRGKIGNFGVNDVLIQFRLEFCGNVEDEYLVGFEMREKGF